MGFHVRAGWKLGTEEEIRGPAGGKACRCQRLIELWRVVDVRREWCIASFSGVLYG